MFPSGMGFPYSFVVEQVDDLPYAESLDLSLSPEHLKPKPLDPNCLMTPEQPHSNMLRSFRIRSGFEIIRV